MRPMRFVARFACGVALGLTAMPVAAELVVSDLIVELHANSGPRKDVEVWNNSDERSYVEISPAEILNPGSPAERRVQEADPEKLGLLVSPNRMILEPGQRKVVRIAEISAEQDRERVYRITVKPVVGNLSGDHSGLKVLVGYDILAIVRPSAPVSRISGSRQGKSLIIRNDGNSSAELINGRQCDPGGRCVNLPGKRLYAGSNWTQELPGNESVEYMVKSAQHLNSVRF